MRMGAALLITKSGSRARLVITHHAGDEGMDYLRQLQVQAEGLGVDLRYVAERVDDFRRQGQNGEKIYALWDTYPHADLIAYPSLYEGFGNALIETIYFRKPALVNRYPVYAADIAPLGFQFVEIEGTIREAAVAAVRSWLQNPADIQAVVAHNYRLGQVYFSYETLEALLRPILNP
jgi:mannosylglucosylglycerate synthase